LLQVLNLHQYVQSLEKIACSQWPIVMQIPPMERLTNYNVCPKLGPGTMENRPSSGELGDIQF
jgi:hypothetical protein